MERAMNPSLNMECCFGNTHRCRPTMWSFIRWRYHFLGFALAHPDDLSVAIDSVSQRTEPTDGPWAVVLPSGQPSHWVWQGSAPVAFSVLIPTAVLEDHAESIGVQPAQLGLSTTLAVKDKRLIEIGTRFCRSVLGIDGSRLQQFDLINDFCRHLLNHYTLPIPTHRFLNPDRKRTVLTFINEHLHRPITLQEIGKETPWTTPHFSRIFKEAIGVTPYKFVLRQRLRLAQRKLLAESNLSIDEIAAACGFIDRQHFTRHFKARYERTPADFRRRA